jgi:hypothetical protein
MPCLCNPACSLGHSRYHRGLWYRAITSDGEHKVNDIYRASRDWREDTAGAIGQEYRPQPFFFLAAEAINEYLEINEWQVAGIKRAIASLDRSEEIPLTWSKTGAL